MLPSSPEDSESDTDPIGDTQSTESHSAPGKDDTEELHAFNVLDADSTPAGDPSGTATDENESSQINASISHNEEDNPKMEELAACLSTINAGFERSEALLAKFADVLEKRLAYDRFKEEQINRLHAELQTYKQDLLARSARPLITGVVRFHNDIGRLRDALTAEQINELPLSRVFKLLDGLRGDVEVLLEQNGVERFENPGEEFDARRQTAIRKLATADAALGGTLATRLRPGFEHGTQLIQKEKVEVYYFDETATVSEPPEVAPDGENDSNGNTDPQGD